MTGPVAYIRRSTASEDNPGEVSRDVQEAAIREMAHRDGFNGDVRYFTDWARSGDEDKIGRRSSYAAMIRALESGEVSTLYAYSLDRLHRSVLQTSKLVKACERFSVRIVTQREGEVRQDTPDQWLRFTTLSTFGEYELRVAKARAQDATARRRARGDYLGVAPFGQRVGNDHQLEDDPREDVAAVLDAYDRAGSFLGAAKVLTAEGLTPPRKGGHWSEQTVQRIVRRHRTIGRTEQGVKQRADHVLYRLLRCPCGTILTPQKKHGGKNTVYFCGTARRDPRHPRPYSVAESLVIEWVKVEASRFSPKGKVPRGDDDALRDALQTRREDVGWAVANRAMSRETATAEIARIETALASLEATQEAVQAPERIEWERWSAADTNATLRAYWSRIELDEKMRPVRADWRVPMEYLRP